MAVPIGVGFWGRMGELAATGRPIDSFLPDLDNDEIVVTYANGPDKTFTFTQVANWLTANAPEWGTWTATDVANNLDAAMRWWVTLDDTAPPLGGWTTETMPGRGGRT